MKTIKTILILCVALCFASSCKKEVDMTLMQKTVLENADIRAVEVGDAWQVTVVADSSTYVELEFSAYLEPYLKTKMNGNQLEIGFAAMCVPSSTPNSAPPYTQTKSKKSKQKTPQN
jgi:hypothetical protein